MKKIVTVILFTLSSLLIAAEPTALKYLEADFKQVKTSQMFTETQLSEGHLTYRAPEYICWEYTSPLPLRWEMDGKQGNVSPQIRRMMKMILSAINGGSFPKNGKYGVQVKVNTQTGIADEVTILETNGDKTHIRFYNVKQ